MATELVLLGTAGAPMPVAGRAGISSALIVDQRVFVIDCGRGAPSGYADARLDFSRLEAVLLTHLHVDHTGDLPGMILYPWGVRVSDNGPLAPIRVYGPSRPETVPAGDAAFHRQTTIHPELPAPGTADLVENILAGYAYHLNVMPLDARMPDAGALVRGFDIPVPARTEGIAQIPVVVFDDGAAFDRMAVLHTDVNQVGGVAERARVRELILSHYLPAEPDAIPEAEWAQRAGRGFSGRTTAGRDGLRIALPRVTDHLAPP
jgi:ribonuclease BN (tRNA processing enzyme)